VGIKREKVPRAYWFFVALLRPALMALTKRDWHGYEFIPRTGGFVISPNHFSHVDPFTFAHFVYDSGRPPRFLAKEAVFRIPVIGRLFVGADQIPVYRNSAQAASAYRRAVQAVNDGKCVAIFPEGTLTRDPGLWPMRGKTGAARVALETQCPVIPVAQWGAQEILGPYAKRPRFFPRKTIHVVAGPPVDLSDLYGKPIDAAVLREATDRIMARITGLLEGLRGEQAPAERFDPKKAGVPETGNPNRRPA
jgi:1-acyl-sn-glycerol-3-phosphate acyltransferase